MPIYEYQCPGCGHRFEKLQKMSEPAVTLCPSCGGEEVRKLVSQSAFILKGAGWYKDHYGLKKEGGADAGKGGADAAGGKAGADGAGGEKAGGEKAGSEKAAPKAEPAASKPASAPAAPSSSSSSAGS